MMSGWSLAYKKIRKEIYFWLVEKSNLNRADAVVVMDGDEMKTAERKGIKPKKFCLTPF